MSKTIPSPTAVYAGRAIEAFAARVRAEGQTVEIKCPSCGAVWDVDAAELTAEKECPSCGHIWEPTLGDFAAGIKRGEAERSKQAGGSGKAPAKTLGALAREYYGAPEASSAGIIPTSSRGGR